jgi:hypothetical protein
MAQRAFDVFLGSKQIDTVFATGYDAAEMRKSLIDHDGYDSRIVVYRRHPKLPAKYDDVSEAT